MLSLEQLGAALSPASSTTYAALRDVVLELEGMCIGGSLSSSAVSTQLYYEEFFCDVPPEQVQWHMYVDGLLAVSRCFCGRCLEAICRKLLAECSKCQVTR